MMAQVTTKTSEQQGQSTQKVTVERGEVVYVAGNELVVKMENGDLRHFSVPDNARATVDGKELGLQDLRPGMKLQRTITTTTTQKTVKTVRAGTGEVLNVMPPHSVVVRFEDGTVQQYKIPKDTKFTIDGQQKTAFELRKGMKISATRIVEAPAVEVSETRRVSGSAPPPPPLQGALLIAEVTPPRPAPEPTSVAAAAPSQAPAPPPTPASEPAPQKLPATGSLVPLVGMLGLLFSGAALGIRLFRRS
jgi:hypothetical protein